MCDDAVTAGTGTLTVKELKILDREHPSFWTNATFTRIYGTPHPNFADEPILSMSGPDAKPAEAAE